MAQTAAPVIDRPYQLLQNEYQLWREIGNRLGTMTQAIVFVALADAPHFRVYDKTLTPGEKGMAQHLATRRGIKLQFL